MTFENRYYIIECKEYYTSNRSHVELKNGLKQARTAKEMTQETLAKNVGVTRQTVIAIEHGKWEPSVKLALEIADKLQRDINDLFWLDSKGETK